MNDLAFLAVMLCSFVLVVYGAHALVQRLRRHGHSARLDALHAATVRAQGVVLRSMGRVLRTYRPSGLQPRGTPPPDDHFSTRQD